mmetsp:Transcript_15726/g.45419  ORF Transcript_15726/g.45419 Transcript_15726/m.45419 type:complete len:285 (+) Transcript_15726:433-1287(+)
MPPPSITWPQAATEPCRQMPTSSFTTWSHMLAQNALFERGVPSCCRISEERSWMSAMAAARLRQSVAGRSCKTRRASSNCVLAASSPTATCTPLPLPARILSNLASHQVARCVGAACVLPRTSIKFTSGLLEARSMPAITELAGMARVPAAAAPAATAFRGSTVALAVARANGARSMATAVLAAASPPTAQQGPINAGGGVDGGFRARPMSGGTCQPAFEAFTDLREAVSGAEFDDFGVHSASASPRINRAQKGGASEPRDVMLMWDAGATLESSMVRKLETSS